MLLVAGIAAVLMTIVALFLGAVQVQDLLLFIKFDTLAMLFSLMAVVVMLERIGAVKVVSQSLLRHARKGSGLTLAMVMLPFFLSMIVTNDVALISMVPLAIATMRAAHFEKQLPWVICLQTVAANLGSMATPIGNPQNIHLVTFYKIPVAEFLVAILPLTVVAFVCLVVACFFTLRGHDVNAETSNKNTQSETCGDASLGIRAKIVIGICIVLFAICIAAVSGAISVWIAAAFVLVAVLVFDVRALTKVDYSLLLTFVFFFIFAGCIGAIPQVVDVITRAFSGNEFWCAVGASQIISNVPAAVLLSNFTSNYRELLLGVNVGGLGTPIASLATLISYNLYAKAERESINENGVNKHNGATRFLALYLLVSVVGILGLYMAKLLIL